MKKIAVLLLLILSFMTLKAAEPDFSKPKTTLDAAIRHYDAAISMTSTSTSGVTMIKSLLEIIGATADIDPDSLVSVVPRIDRAINAYSGPDKALIMTVKAELLNAVYSANRWTYDRMETPDDPLPADITEWNGRQFCAQIQSLLTDAFNLAATIPDAKLSNYKSVIEADRTTFIYFPTVASFIATKATSYNFAEKKFKNEFINQMLAISQEKSAPWFYWSLRSDEINEYWSARPQLYVQDANALSPDAFRNIDRLFLDNSDREEAGIILNRVASYYSHLDTPPDWIIGALRDFISRYPSFWEINDLKNALNLLTQGRAKIKIARIAPASHPVKINVSLSFTDNCDVKIYKISEDEFEHQNIKLQDKPLCTTLSIKNCNAEGRTDTILTANINSPGYYVAVPAIDGSMKNASKAFFMCSDYMPLLIKSVDPNAFIIADLTDGSPVKGVSVAEQDLQLKKQPRRLGKSNANGILKFSPVKATEENRWLNFEYIFTKNGNAIKFPNFNNYSSNYSSDKEYYSISIFLEREIYHPGDTVNWAAILTVYSSETEELIAAADKLLKAQLLDVNDQIADSIALKTDALGRIHGSFAIPETGLTGKYRLSVSKPNGRDETRDVTVSDFKLPTFKIDDLSVSRDTPSMGDVTIKGNASSFSGMPISGAKVEAEIWIASDWRWSYPTKKIGLIQATTDDKGDFTLIANDSLLAASERKRFIAKITVTSLAGEAQTESKPFTTGKPYMIDFDGSELNDTDSPLTDLFLVNDADGNSVDIELRWWLNKSGDKPFLKDAVASGICSSAKGSSIDLSTVPSGVYSLSVEPLDSTLADPCLDISKLQLYSIQKNTLPDITPIFLLHDEYITDSDGHAEIILGTPADDSYYFMATAYRDQLRAIDLLHYDRGFHKIIIQINPDEQYLTIDLITVRDGIVTKKVIRVQRPDKRVLSLEGSAMRNKLTPGDTERWTLKLRDFKDDGVAGGMIATMFNAALNSIAPYRLPINLYHHIYLSSINVSNPSDYTQAAQIRKQLNLLKQQSLLLPEFNPSIEYNALAGSRIRIRGTMSAEGAESEEMVYSIGVASNMSMKMAAFDAAMDEGEIIAFAEETTEVAVADNDASEALPSPDVEYRPSEVLQAFWMPELTFNAQGEAELSFTVPNANTIWAFNAFAWTADLRSAKMVREFVASKPVMVQPNLPRFLRAGDRADILATVFNNSDSAAVITTVVEIFDIATGEIKSQFTSSDTVKPAASAIVSASVEADGDVSAIGYRVRSTLGRFTDGEQSFIPVIAATSDVIESANFYLNPGDPTAEVKVPDGKKIRSTLDYTANPAWAIIRELPGLATVDALTSIGASAQLFGSATAAGLLRSYPQLAEVLKAWSDDPDSKALTSRLAKNDELKAAVLSSTPWVQAAAGDTERMARLSLLFDRKATDKSISASIATLRKLQRPDGGWAWGEWCKISSPWSTNAVLQNLGRLNDIGYLPADPELKQMIAKAIAYYITQIPTSAKTDHSLAYIVTLFPDVEIDLRGKQIVNATIQDIVATWKRSSTWHKAIEALILDRNGYKAVAREIIASLSEFAVASANKGTSFPSVNNVNDYTDLLYAFGRIAPGSKIIDGMRQWLILRQQTTEQLGSCDPTRVIAAFAASGSDWFGVNASSTEFTLGGQELTVGEAELATGHIVYNLPSSAGGKTLAVNRGNAATVPAYGSVISRFTAKSSAVKARSCSDLSVEKRITALRDGRWQYVDNVQLGEQVRVLLTIKVKRDLEYVTVIDERLAAFEPVDQLPGWVWNGGAGFYRENRDSATNLFIDYLPKGTYQITIDMTATIAGDFTSGIATVQSQLTPSITAHSAGSTIKCK